MAESKKRRSLWYSSFRKMEQCPRQFAYKYGIPGVDLGGGEGEPLPLKEKHRRSEHWSLMGTVIQAAIETLYQEKWWLEPETLQSRLEAEVNRVFPLALDNSYIIWREAPRRQEMLDRCHVAVINYARTMYTHRLFGPYAQSEVKVKSSVGGHLIGAKIDMLIRRCYEVTDDEGNTETVEDVLILDGKNSLKKNADPDQLRYYALCFYNKHGVLPDKIGFVYFQYPVGYQKKPEDVPETGIDWVPFTLEDLTGLGQRVVDVAAALVELNEKAERGECTLEDYEARPRWTRRCQYCDYEPVCPERQAQKAANSAKRRKNKKKTAPVQITPDSQLPQKGPFLVVGFDDFDFGQGEA